MKRNKLHILSAILANHKYIWSLLFGLTYLLNDSQLVSKSTRCTRSPVLRCLVMRPSWIMHLLSGSIKFPFWSMWKPKKVMVIWSWLKNRYGWELSRRSIMLQQFIWIPHSFQLTKMFVTINRSVTNQPLSEVLKGLVYDSSWRGDYIIG